MLYCALRFKISASLWVDLPKSPKLNFLTLKALIFREQAESLIERREEDFGCMHDLVDNKEMLWRWLISLGSAVGENPWKDWASCCDPRRRNSIAMVATILCQRIDSPCL